MQLFVGDRITTSVRKTLLTDSPFFAFLPKATNAWILAGLLTYSLFFDGLPIPRYNRDSGNRGSKKTIGEHSSGNCPRFKRDSLLIHNACFNRHQNQFSRQK